MNDLNTKVKLVRMNDADISTLEKPIIGTNALASCVGILLYNVDKKIAIVAHLSSEWRETLEKVFKLISMYKLDCSVIKYKIIPGYYPNHYNVKEDVENVFKAAFPVMVPFEDNEIRNNDIDIDEETTSKRFAFDSENGNFVTEFIDFDQVYFNTDYENKRK